MSRKSRLVVIFALGISFVVSFFSKDVIDLFAIDDVLAVVGSYKITKKSLAKNIRIESFTDGLVDDEYNKDTDTEKLQKAIVTAQINMFADDNGIDIGDDLIKEYIHNNTIFHANNGKFSGSIFRSFLYRNEVSEDDMRLYIASELKKQYIAALINADNIFPDDIILNNFRSRYMKLDIAYIEFPYKNYCGSYVPRDEEIEAFFEKNKENFISQEKRDFDVIKVNQSSNQQSSVDSNANNGRLVRLINLPSIEAVKAMETVKVLDNDASLEDFVAKIEGATLSQDKFWISKNDKDVDASVFSLEKGMVSKTFENNGESFCYFIEDTKKDESQSKKDDVDFSEIEDELRSTDWATYAASKNWPLVKYTNMDYEKAVSTVGDNLADVVFDLDNNTVSPLVGDDQEQAIAKVNSIVPSTLMNLEQARDVIKDSLIKNKSLSSALEKAKEFIDNKTNVNYIAFERMAAKKKLIPVRIDNVMYDTHDEFKDMFGFGKGALVIGYKKDAVYVGYIKNIDYEQSKQQFNEYKNEFINILNRDIYLRFLDYINTLYPPKIYSNAIA